MYAGTPEDLITDARPKFISEELRSEPEELGSIVSVCVSQRSWHNQKVERSHVKMTTIYNRLCPYLSSQPREKPLFLTFRALNDISDSGTATCLSSLTRFIYLKIRNEIHRVTVMKRAERTGDCSRRFSGRKSKTSAYRYNKEPQYPRLCRYWNSANRTSKPFYCFELRRYRMDVVRPGQIEWEWRNIIMKSGRNSCYSFNTIWTLCRMESSKKIDCVEKSNSLNTKEKKEEHGQRYQKTTQPKHIKENYSLCTIFDELWRYVELLCIDGSVPARLICRKQCYIVVDMSKATNHQSMICCYTLISDDIAMYSINQSSRYGSRLVDICHCGYVKVLTILYSRR